MVQRPATPKTCVESDIRVMGCNVSDRESRCSTKPSKSTGNYCLRSTAGSCDQFARRGLNWPDDYFQTDDDLGREGTLRMCEIIVCTLGGVYPCVVARKPSASSASRGVLSAAVFIQSDHGRRCQIVIMWLESIPSALTRLAFLSASPRAATWSAFPDTAAVLGGCTVSHV